ncbi:MAG: hypothetical protein GXP35_11690 [Actinobacteria bacterium]|nr:hypothetical protein [Actinomycetota bacterium]
MKKATLAGLAVPALILGGAVMVGAQTSDTEADTSTDTPSDSETKSHGPEGHGPGGTGGPGGSGIGQLLEGLDLDRAEIRDALEAGATVAELAAQQGVDLDAAIDEIVAGAEERIAENPDSRFAENFDANELRQRLTDVVNGEVEFGQSRFAGGAEGRRGHVGAGPGGFGALADALGLDQSDIREALQGGSTIAELADENDVDIDSVIAGIVADAEVRIAENPDSRFAENFDADELKERLESVVNGERPERPDFDGEGHGPGHRGRGGFGRGGFGAGLERGPFGGGGPFGGAPATDL